MGRSNNILCWDRTSVGERRQPTLFFGNQNRFQMLPAAPSRSQKQPEARKYGFNGLKAPAENGWTAPPPPQDPPPGRFFWGDNRGVCDTLITTRPATKTRCASAGDCEAKTKTRCASVRASVGDCEAKRVANLSHTPTGRRILIFDDIIEFGNLI